MPALIEEKEFGLGWLDISFQKPIEFGMAGLKFSTNAQEFRIVPRACAEVPSRDRRSNSGGKTVTWPRGTRILARFAHC